MKRLVLSLVFLVFGSVLAQEPPVWERTEQADAFSGVKYSQFVLAGRFLSPPKSLPGSPPSLFLKCQEGQHGVGYHVYRGGNRLATYLTVGAVLNRTPGGVPVMYRLDDGKPQSEIWPIGTDGTAAFFGETTFNNLIYGHSMAHKENSTPPVRKVVIALDEAFAGRIVILFDMPDPSMISEACGMIIHKK